MTIADSLLPRTLEPVHTEAVRARDIMSTSVFTIEAQMPVIAAAESMLARRMSNAPVVEVDFTRRMLVGFVSEKDLMQCYATGQLYARPEILVSEIMRPHPIAVRPEADLFSLAAIFMQHAFRHVPVVRAGMLEGMVSRRDVLNALLDHYREWQKLDPTRRRAPDLAAVFAPRFLIG